MARTGKVGIDYFTHDVDMVQDTKIKLIKAKHGLTGYAIFLRLLEEIYRENGYFIKADDDFNILFANDNGVDLNAYIEVLNDCIYRELFNNKLYKDYQILTSCRIQKNYIDAISRRKSVEFVEQYLLVNPDDYVNERVNVNIIRINVNSKGKNVNIGTQRESKEKVNRNRKEYPLEFEQFYQAYPRPENKAQTFINWKAAIKKYSIEELQRTAERYTEAMAVRERDYITNSSNFVGKKSVYYDYLDDNYVPPKSKSEYPDLTYED